MEKIKESISLVVYPMSNKVPSRIHFYVKKNSVSDEAYKCFISKNLIKDYAGAYGLGIYLNLNSNLNLKEFKMEIFKQGKIKNERT